MGTYLICVGLLSICSLCFSQDQGHLENVNFQGSDIISLYSPDAEHCHLLCTHYPSCKFFTFFRPDWTRDDRHFYCKLKSTPSGQPNGQIALLGVTSGISHRVGSLQPQPCLSQVYQNVDFPGADYRSLFTADYEECQRACTQDPACQFFTFINGLFMPEKLRYKCHLKYSWTIPRTPVVHRKAGTVSGFSHNVQMSQGFDTACQGKLFANTDIPGSDIQMLPAASPEHCQTLCSAHPLCTYFSHDSNSLSCHLKNNPEEMVIRTKEGVTSGIPARFCQLDNNWVKVAHEGVDFPGSDIRYELMNDTDTCQRNCTEDPNCHFYTHVNENSFDKSYWNRCYLKRVITMPSPPKVTKLNNAVSGFSLRACSTHSTHTSVK